MTAPHFFKRGELVTIGTEDKTVYRVDGFVGTAGLVYLTRVSNGKRVETPVHCESLHRVPKVQTYQEGDIVYCKGSRERRRVIGFAGGNRQIVLTEVCNAAIKADPVESLRLANRA